MFVLRVEEDPQQYSLEQTAWNRAEPRENPEKSTGEGDEQVSQERAEQTSKSSYGIGQETDSQGTRRKVRMILRKLYNTTGVGQNSKET